MQEWAVTTKPAATPDDSGRTAEPPYLVIADGGRLRRVHNGLILGLSALAFCVAMVELARHRVQPWEAVTALTLFVVTYLPITVGFHRLLAHRAFKTRTPVKVLLMIFGCMAGQGPPIYWVATHRRHHRFSDQVGDPHSPLWVGDGPARDRLRGFWYAQVGWLFSGRTTNTIAYARDLFQDRVVVWVNQRYFLWLSIGIAIPALAGWLCEPSWVGVGKGLLWGWGVRVFLSYHLTNFINSVTHMFGYRSFSTREHSTNHAWLALPTLGEALHNNHHACPRSAIFALRWWEIDIGGLFIRLLELMGLATAVAQHQTSVMEKLRSRGAAKVNEEDGC